MGEALESWKRKVDRGGISREGGALTEEKTKVMNVGERERERE